MHISKSIVLCLIVIILLSKFYNAFNTINKKGIKYFFVVFFKQKFIMLSIIAVIFGLIVLINPGFKFKNQKDILITYVESFEKN